MTAEKVAIIGSRTWPTPADISAYVLTLPPGTVVLGVDTDGPSTVAIETAEHRGLATVVHRLNTQRDGDAASHRRFAALIEDCDRLVAFCSKDPATKHITTGTQMCLDIAKRQDTPIEIIATPVPGALCQIIARLRLRFAGIPSAPTPGHHKARINSARKLVDELVIERDKLAVWLGEGWEELSASPDGPETDKNTDTWVRRLRVYEICSQTILDAETVFAR